MEKVKSSTIQDIREHDFRAKSRPIVGHKRTDGIIPVPVTSSCFKKRPDILDNGSYLKLIGQNPPEPSALILGLLFGHQQRNHALTTQYFCTDCCSNTA